MQPHLDKVLVTRPPAALALPDLGYVDVHRVLIQHALVIELLDDVESLVAGLDVMLVVDGLHDKS